MVNKAAVIGCGRVGVFYDYDPKRTGINTHAKAYHLLDNFHLAALVDTRSQTLSQLEGKYPHSRLYSEIDQMLNDIKPDIVSICVDTTSQIGVLYKVLNSGVKKIICEKPVSQDAKKMDEVQTLIKNLNAHVFVNYFREFDSFHQEIIPFIKQNLGSVKTIRGMYSNGIFNFASHMISFFLQNFEISTIDFAKFVKKDSKVDPLVSFSAKLNKGEVDLQVDAIETEDYRLFEIDFICEKGRFILKSDYTFEVLTAQPSSRTSEFKELLEYKATLSTPRSDHYQNLLNACISCNNPDNTNFNRSVRVIDIINRILSKAKESECNEMAEFKI